MVPGTKAVRARSGAFAWNAERQDIDTVPDFGVGCDEERARQQKLEALSTVAASAGGPARSSGEASVTGRLGVDRLVVAFAKRGRRHSFKRVRRLAREVGLSCVRPRPYRATTLRDDANPDGLSRSGWVRVRARRLEPTLVYGYNVYAPAVCLGLREGSQLISRKSYAHQSRHRPVEDGHRATASRNRRCPHPSRPRKSVHVP